jgi:hypothetical protein
LLLYKKYCDTIFKLKIFYIIYKEKNRRYSIMKKKKSLVFVATALMLCLVVGMGAFTFAKYITSGNTNQKATAAKWGFVVNVDADNLFGTKYGDVSDSLAGYVPHTLLEVQVGYVPV